MGLVLVSNGHGQFQYRISSNRSKTKSGHCKPTGLSKEHLIDAITLYSGLKTQTNKVEAALKLAELELFKTRIKRSEGHKLYGGTGFEEFQERNKKLKM